MADAQTVPLHAGAASGASAPDLEPRDDSSERRWDPFVGSVPNRREAFVPRQASRTGRQKLHLGGVALGFALVAASAVLGMGFLFPVGAIVAFGFAFTYPSDGRTDEDDRNAVKMNHALQATSARLAKARGDALRLAKPVRIVRLPADHDEAAVRAKIEETFPGREVPAVQMEGFLDEDLRKRESRSDDDRTLFVTDPSLAPAYAFLRRFLMPSPVVAVPTRLVSMHNWTHDGLPLWTGLGVLEGDARNPKRTGGLAKGPAIHTLYAVTAGRLDRADPLRATLRAEIPFLPSRRDAKLEGQLFNETFKIDVTKGAEQDLYRAFTPAAQTFLLDLFERYGAEVMLHDGLLVLRASDAFSLNPDEDPDGATARLRQLTEDVADAFAKLKRYIE